MIYKNTLIITFRVIFQRPMQKSAFFLYMQNPYVENISYKTFNLQYINGMRRYN